MPWNIWAIKTHPYCQNVWYILGFVGEQVITFKWTPRYNKNFCFFLNALLQRSVLGFRYAEQSSKFTNNSCRNHAKFLGHKLQWLPGCNVTGCLHETVLQLLNCAYSLFCLQMLWGSCWREVLVSMSETMMGLLHCISLQRLIIYLYAKIWWTKVQM